MSVLVRGMEMPRTCAVCEWSDYLHPNAYCRCEQTTVNIETAKTSRPEWCPLVEVKEPHGRLIDADALANKTFYNPVSAPYITYRAFIDAPTIIEAEGREE